MKTTIRYVLTLAALLLSSSSFAVEYYGHSSSGSYSHTPESVCPLIASYYGMNLIGPVNYQPPSHPIRCQMINPSNNATYYYIVSYYNQSSCPTQLPNEWEDGTCHLEPEPPPECPDGQFNNGNGCEHGCVAGAEVKQVIQIEQVQSTIIDPILGCNLNISATKKPECNFNTFMCNVYYTDSGEYNELFDKDPNYEPEPEPEQSPEPIATETVDGPITETVNNPDGSTTTTETTTTTNVNDQGHLVEIVGDSIVLKNQAGEIIEILQQYETNTYTDGTSQVTETTTTTATPNSITEVKKNLTDGSTTTTTRTYNQGLSGSTTTTKTTTYDAQGKPTGSATISNGSISETDGSDDGGEPPTEGMACGGPDQPPCNVLIKENPDDFPDYNSGLDAQDAEIDGVMNNLMDMLSPSNDFGTNDMDWTKPDYWIANFLNMPQAVSCSGGINTVIFGRPFNLDPCEKLLPLREILAWTFYIITLFTVSHILLGRKLA
jgi:hypothetical protein